MGWIRACAAEEVEPGEAIVLDTEPPVAVFHVGGEFLATSDTCTHAESSLGEEGYIEGGEVECSWHMARFCLRTGKALSLPATEPLLTYRTEVRPDGVFVDIPDRPNRPG